MDEQIQVFLGYLREGYRSQLQAMGPMVEGMTQQLNTYEAQVAELNEKLDELEVLLGVAEDEEEVEETEEESSGE